MVRQRIKREKSFDRGQEIVGDGAADAAIGEFDDSFLAAGKIATAIQHFRIDADIAKFVDDEGEAAAVGIFHEVANKGRLPRAKKAGDDRCRDFGKTVHEKHPVPAMSRVLEWGSRTNPAPSPAVSKPRRHR